MATFWMRTNLFERPAVDTFVICADRIITVAKVAAAEEHGLKNIPGMKPQKVRSIVTQAREMTSEAEKSRPKTWKH
jgi:hypothetical protein